MVNAFAPFQVHRLIYVSKIYDAMSMGLLQELLNANEENMREILQEGWVLDWVERAREEIDDYGFFQAFWFQLFSVHSFFRSASSDSPVA